jgi:hypothetical protein
MSVFSEMRKRERGIRRSVSHDGSVSSRDVRADTWGAMDSDQELQTNYAAALSMGIVNATPKECPLAAVLYAKADAVPPPRAQPKVEEPAKARSQWDGLLIGKTMAPAAPVAAPVLPVFAYTIGAMPTDND